MKLTKEAAEKIFSAENYEEAKRIAAEIGWEMTAEADAVLKKHFTREMSDNELNQVAGGNFSDYEQVYSVDFDLPEYDSDLIYCPACKVPMYPITLDLYRCPQCRQIIAVYYHNRI